MNTTTSCNKRKSSSSGSKVDYIPPTAQQLIVRGPLRSIQPIGKMPPKNPPQQSSEIDLYQQVFENFGNITSPRPDNDKKNFGDSKSPTSDNDSYEETVVSNEHIAIAFTSFFIVAALIGVCCCIRKREFIQRLGASRNRDVNDPSVEGNELRVLLPSPRHEHHHSSQQTTQLNGDSNIRT